MRYELSLGQYPPLEGEWLATDVSFNRGDSLRRAGIVAGRALAITALCLGAACSAPESGDVDAAPIPEPSVLSLDEIQEQREEFRRQLEENGTPSHREVGEFWCEIPNRTELKDYEKHEAEYGGYC